MLLQGPFVEANCCLMEVQEVQRNRVARFHALSQWEPLVFRVARRIEFVTPSSFVPARFRGLGTSSDTPLRALAHARGSPPIPTYYSLLYFAVIWSPFYLAMSHKSLDFPFVLAFDYDWIGVINGWVDWILLKFL